MDHLPQDGPLLSPIEAAYHLGITRELLFQFTKRSFARASGLRSLRTVEIRGETRFARHELDEFDALLAGPWTGSAETRPAITKAIVDHLRAESRNQCARCGSGIGVDTAHIVSWAESRSHHPHNLIRLCSRCHREHDTEHSLPTYELRALKDRLIARTRETLIRDTGSRVQRLRPPRPSPFFAGRQEELAILAEALQSGKSVVISGSGGAGKSELLLQALSGAGPTQIILWLDVEQYPTAADVLAALQTALGSDDQACSDDELSLRLDELGACVIIDGIERGGPDDFDRIEDLLVRLIASSRNSQFVCTTQAVLHRFPAETRLKLSKLDEVASKSLLMHYRAQEHATSDDGAEDLLAFCDGHPLTLRIAGALSDHHGSPKAALEAVRRKGVQSLSLPGRRSQTRQTSLELCLETAYDALPTNARELLWALAEAPGGFWSHYIDNGFVEIRDPADAHAELRHWHLIETERMTDRVSRIRVLAPIRKFAIERGKRDAPSAFEELIHRLINGLGSMIAVLELKYDDPNETPYVLQRFGDELPNFLHVLDLAKERTGDVDLVTTSLMIVRALMRYFFVLRLSEQGARVMRDAAELALETGQSKLAIGFAVQMVALDRRTDDGAPVEAALDIVRRVETSTDDPEAIADIHMCKAMACREEGDSQGMEVHARRAFERYAALLRVAAGGGEDAKFRATELHNDVANALGLLGSAQLAQRKYEDAGKAYRHSLQHLRGASIAVNRGQTLHQIGNCESNIGRHDTAAKLYTEAARIFHFVGMEEYLSNATGELGYSLLDVDRPDLLEQIDEDLLERALDDVAADVRRTYDAARALDPKRCVNILRKLFGTIILTSLAFRGEKLAPFAAELANRTVVPLGDQVRDRIRDPDDLVPIMLLDSVLQLAFLVAQGELDYEENADISPETTGDILKLVCNADP